MRAARQLLRNAAVCLCRTENVLLEVGQVTFEPSQRRQDLSVSSPRSVFTKREAIAAVSTDRKPIPKTITTMATIRPWTLVGYASSSPTVVTVSTAHQMPSQVLGQLRSQGPGPRQSHNR